MDDRPASSTANNEALTTATPSPSTTTPPDHDKDDDYRLQLMILDQQNKGRPGYVPAVTDPSTYPRKLDGTIVDDPSTCDQCTQKMYMSDDALWSDLKRHVHVALPVHLRVGPDMHQCFCGYFSFRSSDLDVHLGEMEQARASMGSSEDGSGVIAELIRRVARVDMHGKCRRKLVALIDEGGVHELQVPD